MLLHLVFWLRIELCAVPNSHSSYTLHTLQNHGSGARIDVHDIRENVGWHNEHIGCGDVRYGSEHQEQDANHRRLPSGAAAIDFQWKTARR